MVESRIKVPNHKHQIPNKHQVPNSNVQNMDAGITPLTFAFLLFIFAFFLKAGPPHVAGGVFFLGGGYGYIKGGEMERLIDIGIFTRFFFGFFGRGTLLVAGNVRRVAGGFLLVIGEVPARALELE
jgi:hypothetical protein